MKDFTLEKKLHEIRAMRENAQKKRYKNNCEALIKLLDAHAITLVLDVGANCGQYAVDLFDGGYKGRVVSFEPLLSAHNELVEISRLFHNWEIAERCALGEREGDVPIYVANNSVSSSLLPMLPQHLEASPESTYVGAEKVHMSTLDQAASHYVREKDITFLKLDVQGYEKYVLQGATALLKKVRGIQIETSFVPLYEGEALFEEMFNMMKENEMDLYDVAPILRHPKTGGVLQADCVFFREEPYTTRKIPPENKL